MNNIKRTKIETVSGNITPETLRNLIVWHILGEDNADIYKLKDYDADMNKEGINFILERSDHNG